jgi:hypothetical protein
MTLVIADYAIAGYGTTLIVFQSDTGVPSINKDGHPRRFHPPETRGQVLVTAMHELSEDSLALRKRHDE